MKPIPQLIESALAQGLGEELRSVEEIRCLLQIRAPAFNFYVLRDPSGLYLIDSGFIGGSFLLHRALRLRGWQHERIRGIIVTHGHLDHILNVSVFARETGAWIAAPRLDAEHYAGKPSYRGLSRVTGWLEGVGRGSWVSVPSRQVAGSTTGT